jgi:hypothetical protein
MLHKIAPEYEAAILKNTYKIPMEINGRFGGDTLWSLAVRRFQIITCLRCWISAYVVGAWASWQYSRQCMLRDTEYDEVRPIDSRADESRRDLTGVFDVKNWPNGR